MRQGLSSTLLGHVRKCVDVVARMSNLPLEDIGWLVSPDDPVLAKLQAERYADTDPIVAGHAVDLDRDIAGLREGWRRDAADLATAPTMVGQFLHVSVLPDLVGVLGAHFRGPVVDFEGRQISRGRITSLVIAVDAMEGRWARTLNRFYRLANDDPEGCKSPDPHSETQGEPS